MSQSSEQHGADLREYIQVLTSRKYEILVVTSLLFAAAMFFTLRQTPIYEGRAKILVRPVQSATTSSVQQAPNVDTERELILSETIALRVDRRLEPPVGVDSLLRHLRVEVVTDTDVLLVKYHDPNAARAAQIANAFAQAYVDYRSQQALSQFRAATAAVQRQIDDVQGQIANATSEANSTNDPVLIDSDKSKRDALIAQLGVLNQRLLDLRSNSSVNADSAAVVIQPAHVGDSPVSPDKVRNGILALLAGLALGVGVAFLRERLDDRVKTRQELERCLGVPVLAAVPRLANGWRDGMPALVTRTDPRSPVSEAYRTLGTNLQYAASRQPLTVIMVTSAMGGDGKTTTAANLAVVLAQAGKRVFLVSADLRRPRLHSFFATINRIGLSNILGDSLSIGDVTVTPWLETLRIVNAGPVPADPAALLGGRRTGELLESLRELADFVIVDTPPVLAVADASIIAPRVDGTIVVVDAERSTRSVLTQTRDQLENAGAHVLGTVYNNFDPTAAGYPRYQNHYYQYYGVDEGSANGKRGSRAARRDRPGRPQARRSGTGTVDAGVREAAASRTRR